MTLRPSITEVISSSFASNDINVPAWRTRLVLREESADQWIQDHASGTLRKNKKIGFAWNDQYIHERTAYEFGWVFETVPASRVTLGLPYTEGDCKSLTEAGWHIERYFEAKFFPDDEYESAYISVEYQDGSRKEGVGIFVRKTSAQWVGKGKAVFAIISEFDKKSETWCDAQNPA